jgi:hypothetical protein
MNISPLETKLVGSWVLNNGKMIADDVCQRIRTLIQVDLTLIAKDWSGWETLYRDNNDGRYWEHTYPHGEMQGGGPPALFVVSAEVAAKKYNLPN